MVYLNDWGNSNTLEKKGKSSKGICLPVRSVPVSRLRRAAFDPLSMKSLHHLFPFQMETFAWYEIITSFVSISNGNICMVFSSFSFYKLLTNSINIYNGVIPEDYDWRNHAN